MSQVCKNCVFYVERLSDGEVYGECHRYAPRPFLTTFSVLAGQVQLAWWPQVKAGQWCGEFRSDSDKSGGAQT